MTKIYIVQESVKSLNETLLGIYNSLDDCLHTVLDSIFKYNRYIYDDLNPKKRFIKTYDSLCTTGYYDYWCRNTSTNTYIISEWILSSENKWLKTDTKYVNFDKMIKDFIVKNKCDKHEIRIYLRHLRKNPEKCMICLSENVEYFSTKDFKIKGESQEIIDEWFDIYKISKPNKITNLFRSR